MIEKGQRLKKGDILRNDWAGKANPQKYTMYIGRGKVGRNPTIDCLSFDMRIAKHSEWNNRLVVVGHLEEYDEFVKALACIRTYEEGELK